LWHFLSGSGPADAVAAFDAAIVSEARKTGRLKQLLDEVSTGFCLYQLSFIDRDSTFP
jgi:hypothetical protein